MDQTSVLEIPAGSEVLREPRARPRRRIRNGLAWLFRGIVSLVDWLFGALALVVGLSVLASIPVAQFLSLGYLLEASGRVANSGRFRDGAVGVRKASRLGRMAVGCVLCLLPIQLVASLARSAEAIDPGGPVARGWRIGLGVATFLLLTHLVASCARGGRIRHFLWPVGTAFWLVRSIRRGGMYRQARDATWDFVIRLRLPHYFRLGLVGFAGTLVWLIVPILILIPGRRTPPLALLGGLLMAVIVPAIPFLQARFASVGRFRAIFERRAIGDRFRRAPWAFALAWTVTVVSAIPLYLLKIEMIPRETAWLPGLLFVAFLLPARVLAGWAYARGGRRELPRMWISRTLGRLGSIPAALFYVLIIFLAQYTSWAGAMSLAEQHAFLLPAPFLGY
jgi:hypothetical protein